MTLFIQEAAERDILSQVEWYAQKGLPHIASRFYQAVTAAIDGLLAMPEAGPPKPTVNRELVGLRTWPVTGFDEFWVYYLTRSDNVIVVRILHSKRDIGSILADQAVEEP